MDNETILTELKIIYLTRKQYQELVDNEKIDSNSLYQITDKEQIISVSCGETEEPVQLSTSGIIPFDKVINQVGDDLILSENKVVIGKGISKVKVSCNVVVGSANRHWFQLKHYGEDKVIKSKIVDLIGLDTSGFLQKSSSPVLVEVEENDYFTLEYTAVNAGGILNDGISNDNATYMTIEVVK